jgi:hypothetical protein
VPKIVIFGMGEQELNGTYMIANLTTVESRMNDWIHSRVLKYTGPAKKSAATGNRSRTTARNR